ncbi:MAG: histidine kinase, partial [Nitrososphaeraceae archaeon]|nr:histidine kinase [Nitrososphaeraceae archaeon]
MSHFDAYVPKKLRSLLKLNLIIAIVITLFFNSRAIMALDYERVIINFIYSYLISLTLSYGITTIIDITNRRYSWIDAPLKRFLIELISVSIYSFAIGCLFNIISILIFNDYYTISNLPWNKILSNALYPVYIALFVTAILTSRAFLFEWRKAAIASEKLRADRFEGQYQSLKNQLNPHFLFNSFNTLTSLVYDDQSKAVDFIQRLSKIYRYVLEVQKEELIKVEDELRFLNNYIELLKVRFSENLNIKIHSIDGQKYLPPLSLQLLLENAIKHNIISAADPLFIEIYEKDEMLVIKNNLQLKSSSENSTGI